MPMMQKILVCSQPKKLVTESERERRERKREKGRERDSKFQYFVVNHTFSVDDNYKLDEKRSAEKY